MSGRHAAADDVDDEAIASTQPAHPGAHRADVGASDSPDGAAPDSAHGTAPDDADGTAPDSAHGTAPDSAHGTAPDSAAVAPAAAPRRKRATKPLAKGAAAKAKPSAD